VASTGGNAARGKVGRPGSCRPPRGGTGLPNRSRSAALELLTGTGPGYTAPEHFALSASGPIPRCVRAGSGL